MKESQIEAMRQMNRKSSDAGVRLRAARDDRAMGRSVEWCRGDSDPKVRDVGANASREVTARQLGIVSVNREESSFEEEDGGRRPRRRQEKPNRRQHDDYED